MSGKPSEERLVHIENCLNDCEMEDDNAFDGSDEEFDCSQYVHDGTIYCNAIGSEDCEFECPYREEVGRDVKSRGR